MCTCLSDATSNVFWSSVALRPRILEQLDIALSHLPFFAGVVEGGTFYGCGLETTLAEAYMKIWIIALRLLASFENEVCKVLLSHFWYEK